MTFGKRSAIAVALLGAMSAPATASPRLTAVHGSPFVSPGAFALAFNPKGHYLAVTERTDPSQVQIYSVANNGVLTPVHSAATGENPDSLAFNRDGKLLAVADEGDGKLWMFHVGSGDALTSAPGSPFQLTGSLTSVAFNRGGNLLAVTEAVQDPTTPSSVALLPVGSGGAVGSAVSTATTGYEPGSVTFSPSAGRLVVANFGDHSLSVFAVGSNDGLTPAPGSPFATGNYGPRAVAFSPNGKWLASAFSAVPCCSTNGAVAMYSVGSSPALSQVPGSPFPSGNDPEGVSFAPGGKLLASTNSLDSTLSLFALASGGTLSQIGTYAVGRNPTDVTFSPHGKFVAVSNIGEGDVSVFRVRRRPH